jgi:hypothetical protein
MNELPRRACRSEPGGKPLPTALCREWFESVRVGAPPWAAVMTAAAIRSEGEKLTDARSRAARRSLVVCHLATQHRLAFGR